MAKAAKQVPVKARKTKRAIGRPSGPSHVVGRDALVDSACELLKVMPPNEVSGVKIAKHCGADPSLIRYYFKDRLGLLIAAAEKLTTEYNPDAVVQAAGEDSRAQFRGRLGRLLELDSANPFFHRLMMEELLLSENKRTHDLLDALTKRGVAAYRGILDRGIARGELHDVNVEMLFVTIVAICQSFDNTYRLYELAAGKKLDRENFREEYSGFLGDLLLQGLERE